MTLTWITKKDFKQLFKYHKLGLLKNTGKSFTRHLMELIGFKAAYWAYAFIIPLIFSPLPWWQTLTGFILMHLFAGLVLACVFQPAHVMPDTDYFVADNEGTIENHWAIHQLLTTCNFAPKSRIFSWYVGGLNYQIEHHLFPNICHVHYKKISNIVRNTAKEFGVPYNEHKSFISALWYHGKMLKQLGRA